MGQGFSEFDFMSGSGAYDNCLANNVGAFA
jgi:hypothetical protein